MNRRTSEAALWGGRFSQPLDESVLRLSAGAARAWRLVPYDLLQSRAHARGLCVAGVLTEAELEQMFGAFAEIEREFEHGGFLPLEAEEDIHTSIERRLIEKLGDLGGKLRAGRSRNDQAATDLRLYLRDALRQIARRLADLQRALADQAEDHLDVIAPGMTHLQHAQPIPIAHQLLAHAQPLARDVERIQDWDRRASSSPLGAAALAGTTLAIDSGAIAAALGFDMVAHNSIDAVADRDFVAEALFVLALASVHTSRMAEDVILWTSEEFRWAYLDDAFATGSSIMPQKKNPDVAEIARGKAGRLVGDLAGFLATLKGLPLAYNRDMQEDKDAAFDAVDTMLLFLPGLSGLVASLRFDKQRIAASAPLGYALATDLAERLVLRGVPFRRAHELVGRLVALCAANGWELGQVPARQLEELAGEHTAELRAPPSLESAVRARTSPGATAPGRVREQLTAIRGMLADQIAWAEADAEFKLDDGRL